MEEEKTNSFSNNEISAENEEKSESEISFHSKASRKSANKNLVDYDTYRNEINFAEKILDEKLKKLGKDELDKRKIDSESCDTCSLKKVDQQRINDLKCKLSSFKEVQDAYSNVFTNYEDLINKRYGNCDDSIFEEKCIFLLKKKYNLIEYDGFPVINKIKSQAHGKSITQINYIEFTIKDTNEPEKIYSFYKVKNDSIPINYINSNKDINLFILIEKEEENKKTFYYASIYFFENECIIRKKFKNLDKKCSKYCVSILEGEVCSDYFDIIKNVDKINNNLLNIDQNDEESISLRKLRDELSKKKELLLNQKSQNFLQIIMEFKTQEYDGLLSAEKDVFIKHKELSIGIPKNSFIIAECKNNCKIEAIIKNIYYKKRKLKLLGIKYPFLFFIGILYDINDDNEKYLKPRQEKLLKDNIFIISSKDLLDEKEKFYENKLENDNNNKVLEILGQIMGKINNMEKRMDNMEKRMDNIESRMDNIEVRISKIEKKLE